MTFTVVWTQPAQDQLADIWLAATDRDAVTAATHAIDTILKNNPYASGRHRSGSRLLTRHPLGVAFDISDADRLVTVWGVWQPR